MWLLTIIVFSHSCMSPPADMVWQTVCGERQGELGFTSEAGCISALDGISLDGKQRFKDRNIRLTDQAIAFCKKRDD